MITTLLVANRGEIARRIIKTAAAMGMSTVAVYADPDAGAPFVTEADRAVALRGRTAAQTYLNIGACWRRQPPRAPTPSTPGTAFSPSGRRSPGRSPAPG